MHFSLPRYLCLIHLFFFVYYEIHTLRIGERKGITKRRRRKRRKKNNNMKTYFSTLPISLSHCRVLISIYLFHMRSYALTHFHTLTKIKLKKKEYQTTKNHFNTVFPPNKFGARYENASYIQRNYVHIICIRIACTNYSRSE